jgi:hypothetical protein
MTMKKKHNASSPRPEKAVQIAAQSKADRETPSEGEIRLKAYQKYCARNGKPGDPLLDWLEAERELRERPAREESGLTERELVLLSAPKSDRDSDPFC